MLGAIRSPGAVTLYRFDSAINWVDRFGAMTRDDSNRSFLKSETQLTTFQVFDNYLFIACATCENGLGFVRVYNPESVRLLGGVLGSDGSKATG